MKKIFKFSALVFLILLLAACGKKEERIVDYVFLYPDIDDQVLEEMSQGGHTDYYDRNKVATGYLESFYPNEPYEITSSSQDKGTSTFIIDFPESDKSLKLSLEEYDLDYRGEIITIWGVSKAKEI